MSFGLETAGYSKVAEAEVLEAEAGGIGRISTDGSGTRFVTVERVELQAVLKELKEEKEERKAIVEQLTKLQESADGTTICVSSITTALAEKFGFQLANFDEDDNDDGEEQESPFQEEEEPQEDLSVRKRPRTSAVVAPDQLARHKEQPPHVPLPKRPRKETEQHAAVEFDEDVIVDVVGTARKTSTPSKVQQSKRSISTTGHRKTSGTLAEKPAKKSAEQKKAERLAIEKEKAKEDKKAKSERQVKALPGGGSLVTWKLNSHGYVTLNSKELDLKAQTLLGSNSKVTAHKMAKLWQADAAGDNPGGVSDFAVALLQHVALSLLGDVAQSGPVVLEKDISISMGDRTERQFRDSMPEPIRTALRYVSAMVFTGKETEMQRKELLEDMVVNVKPYIDAIRKGQPFPTLPLE